MEHQESRDEGNEKRVNKYQKSHFTYPMHTENVMTADALIVKIRKLLNNLSSRSSTATLYMVGVVVESLRVESIITA
jgi:hypothetical protein